MRIAFAVGFVAVVLALQVCAEVPAAPMANYSAAGLYNLANSYARAGKPGLAVLNYERAALLTPNDPDVAANLKAVRASAHVKVAPGTRLEFLARAAAPATVAAVGVVGVLIAGFGVLIGILSPRRRWLSAAIAATGLVAVGFTVCNVIFWRTKLHEAVVIAATTQMRATPVPMGDPLQQLSEAETVTVTSAHEDFVLVRIQSGRQGWVARADLVEVIPRAAEP